MKKEQDKNQQLTSFQEFMLRIKRIRAFKKQYKAVKYQMKLEEAISRIAKAQVEQQECIIKLAQLKAYSEGKINFKEQNKQEKPKGKKNESSAK